jgi:hypothetical protein
LLNYIALIDGYIASIPDWEDIDVLMKQMDGDMGHVAQIKAFFKGWVDIMEACDARIKTLRGDFEWN